MSDRQGRPSGPDFPCADLDSALSQLRRPPTAAAVRFKVQNTTQSAAQIAAYVDARLVYDRLDQVCGRRWHADYEALPPALIPPSMDADGVALARPALFVRCRLSLYGTTRQDVGEGTDPKAAFSDAIKRAAVQFGVGRVLYAMRLPWLKEGTGDGELRRNRKGRLILDGRSEAWCREQYGRWLEHRGVRLYGEPLDHGDEHGAAAPDDERGAEGVDQAPPIGASEDRPGALERSLRLVADPLAEPGDAEAQRRSVAHWQGRAGYGDDTVAALAQLVCGVDESAYMTAVQLAQLAWQLEVATKAKLSEGDLDAELSGALQADDREAALRAFTAKRIGQAQEVGLLGRRAA